MSVVVWRIATDARSYTADDMTGTGAKLSGGRWNDVGVAMVYTASTRALACLETVVHLNAGGLPFNRYLVEVEIPDDLWSIAEVAGAPSLPVGWDAEPAGNVSVEVGSALDRCRSISCASRSLGYRAGGGERPDQSCPSGC